VKKLWDYIKSNELQNPQKKQEIICDGKLRALFNVDRVHMFTMNKVQPFMVMLMTDPIESHVGEVGCSGR
jgi:chromatin remodeling complex protein RSC6